MRARLVVVGNVLPGLNYLLQGLKNSPQGNLKGLPLQKNIGNFTLKRSG
jgi:hypothetical protein